MRNFEERLKGGHPNSLGNTIEIVDEVLANPILFDELFHCYFSQDEVVRLRVSNAMKRICKVEPKHLIPYMDRFIDEISTIDQPSTKWTFAQLMEMLDAHLSSDQLEKVKKIIQNNLETESDWIVLNTSMDALCKWALSDSQLTSWLLPYLHALSKDKRKSVSKKAHKLSLTLQSPNNSVFVRV